MNNVKFTLGFVLLGLLLTSCTSQEQLACEETVQEQPGPWQGDLNYNWLDADGKILEQGMLLDAAGVPSVIEDATGRLVLAFQWFPCDAGENAFDKVAVMFSEDEGKTWSDPESVQIEGMPETYKRPFDPTLALLDDGRIRMYFTSNANGENQITKDTNIYSAISEDGVSYTFEDGVRFDVEDEGVYDSAVGYWDDYWHIVAPNDMEGPVGRAHHGISKDGLDFEMQENIDLKDKSNWGGNFLTREDGLYFYGSPNKGGNWFTRTVDGKKWSSAKDVPRLGGDPAVYCKDDGTCLFVTVNF